VRDTIRIFYRRSRGAFRAAHLGLGLSMVLSASVAASAADLPLKALPAPALSWTGCYIGLNGGAAMSGSSFGSVVDPGTHLVAAADLATANASGFGSANDLNFIGGGQVGCSLQRGAAVVGIEGDWDYFGSQPSFNNPNGTLTTGDSVSITQTLKTTSLATIRPRLGIVSDRTLIYLTGGAAFAQVRYSQAYADTINNATGTAAGSTTLIGWTVGAGWEWAWTDHVSVKTEYLFAKFPTIAALGGIADTAGLSNVLHGSADLTIQTARLGLNYRF
jgi:outer membrane immunogenic protein